MDSMKICRNRKSHKSRNVGLQNNIVGYKKTPYVSILLLFSRPMIVLPVVQIWRPWIAGFRLVQPLSWGVSARDVELFIIF